MTTVSRISLINLTFLLVLFVSLCLLCPSEGVFTWRDLTDAELEQWYTPTDLCMLKSDDRSGYPQQIRAKNCSEFSKGSSRLACSVGMGSNKQPCFSPFVSRPSFKRGIVGYTDATKTPLMDTFRNLARANVTAVFIGDSTTRQKVSALECELQREHPKNSFKGITFGILPCHTEFEIRLHDSSHVVKMHAVSIGPNSVECLKDGLGAKDPDGKGVYENARHIINTINDQGNGVLVIGNLGLWYNDDAVFDAVIPGVLNWLTRVGSNKQVQNVVAWHETMSQHWVNDVGSGYFNKKVVDEQEATWFNGQMDLNTIDVSLYQVPNCCVGITNTSWGADWRNDIVRKHITQEGRSKYVTLLPFAEATRATPDMHVCHQRFKHDCTHYCYWPLLWQPLWYQMAQLSSKFSLSIGN